MGGHNILDIGIRGIDAIHKIFLPLNVKRKFWLIDNEDIRLLRGGIEQQMGQYYTNLCLT